MSQLFESGGQGASTSASVLPMNVQGWFPLGWTGLISLQSKGLSRDNKGTRNVIRLCRTTEGTVPASQSMTKRGPLEKGMANHFSILTLRNP